MFGICLLSLAYYIFPWMSCLMIAVKAVIGVQGTVENRSATDTGPPLSPPLLTVWRNILNKHRRSTREAKNNRVEFRSTISLILPLPVPYLTLYNSILKKMDFPKVGILKKWLVICTVKLPEGSVFYAGCIGSLINALDYHHFSREDVNHSANQTVHMTYCASRRSLDYY